MFRYLDCTGFWACLLLLGYSVFNVLPLLGYCKSRKVTHDNHYIPKVYLKQWSDDGLHVWAYRLLVSNENVPEWHHCSMDNTAFLRDLYTEIENEEEIDEFEKWLEFEFENPVQDNKMKPTVLRTGCQRGVRLKIALVERHHRPKRTAAYYLVRPHAVSRNTSG